jgi:Flp pilus assembly pilin Flp
MEMGLMVAAIAVLQITLSYLLSRNLKKASLVERIRYQG